MTVRRLFRDAERDERGAILVLSIVGVVLAMIFSAMAVDLGFTARVRAQLQIEKAQSMEDLTGVVELLCKHLKATPLMALRLNKLKQLAHVAHV